MIVAVSVCSEGMHVVRVPETREAMPCCALGCWSRSRLRFLRVGRCMFGPELGRGP